MSVKLKKLSRTLLSFLIAGLFLYLAFRGTNFSDLWKSLQQVDYLWVLAMVPVTLASHWVRGVRWASLLAPVKQHVSRRNLFSAVMIGFMVNNLLPRVGELVRAYAIGRSEGVSKSSALGTVVVERILDLMTFFLLFCIVLFVYPHTLDPFVDNIESVRPFFFFGSLASVALLMGVFLKIDFFLRIFDALQRIVPGRFRHQYVHLLTSFKTGFGVAKMRDKFVWIILLSFVMWSLYALNLYVAFFAFDSLTSFQSDFGASVILLTIASVAFILPAPGALGTYHSFLTVALVHLYNVDAVTALSYSIITHELGYFLTTIVGLYYFVKDHIKVSDVALQAADGEAA